MLLCSVIVGCCCFLPVVQFHWVGRWFFSLVVLFKFWLWLWLWFIPKCVLFLVFVFTVSGYCSVHFGYWCLFWKMLWAMICESNGTDSTGKMASSEGSLAANLWSVFWQFPGGPDPFTLTIRSLVDWNRWSILWSVFRSLFVLLGSFFGCCFLAPRNGVRCAAASISCRPAFSERKLG